MSDKIDGTEGSGAPVPPSALQNANVIPLEYKTTVKLLKDQQSGISTSYCVPHDVVLALDEGIAPAWTATHTFKTDTDFQGSVNLAQGSGQPAGALAADGASLKYAVVSTSAKHEFHVGGNAVAQIDDPSNPQGETSLVSKSYVDTHGGGGGTSVQPGKPLHPAVSIGTAVSGGSADTFMRSDVVLGLDQSIAPQWSGVHTFLSTISFGASAAATLGLDNGVSLKYTVGAGTHEFYVNGKAVGQIDDPSNPQASRSLVGKAYVDSLNVGQTSSKYIAFSTGPLGIDAPAKVDSPSHGSFAIGQGAGVTSSSGAFALGTESSVTNAATALAVGFNAVCTGSGSIALGATSNDGGKANVLSIGCTAQQRSGPVTRRIINVANGIDDTDAATVGQIKSNQYFLASPQTGQAPQASGSNSIAIGGDSSDQGQDWVFSVGQTLVHSPVFQRRIINVADGKAGNEAATVGQLQSCTAPRLTLYCKDGLVGMNDGVAGNGQIDTLADWPITSGAILRSDTYGENVVRVARFARQPCKHAVTFLLYLNDKKIGEVAFEAGQSTGSIHIDDNSNVGYWPLNVGDLVSLTRPHPPVQQDETAQGLVVVINASVIWSATATGN
jgi:hypothetical protein